MKFSIRTPSFLIAGLLALAFSSSSFGSNKCYPTTQFVKLIEKEMGDWPDPTMQGAKGFAANTYSSCVSTLVEMANTLPADDAKQQSSGEKLIRDSSPVCGCVATTGRESLLKKLKAEVAPTLCAKEFTKLALGNNMIELVTGCRADLGIADADPGN